MLKERDINVFNRYLNHHEIHTLLSFTDIVKLPAGYIIDLNTSHWKGVFVILRGQVNLCSKLLNNQTIETLNIGDYFGENTKTNVPYFNTFYITSTPVELVFIPYHYLDLMHHLYPQTKHKIDMQITQQLIDRMSNFTNKLNPEKLDFTRGEIWGKMMAEDNPPCKKLSTKIDLECIKHSQCFSTFTPQELEILFSHFHVREYPRNTLLMQDFDACIIIKGAIQVNNIIDSKMAKLTVLSPVHLCLNIDNLTETSNVGLSSIACEHLVVLCVPADQIKALKTNHRIWYKLYDLFLDYVVLLKHEFTKLYIRLNINLKNK